MEAVTEGLRSAFGLIQQDFSHNYEDLQFILLLCLSFGKDIRKECYQLEACCRVGQTFFGGLEQVDVVLAPYKPCFAI